MLICILRKRMQKRFCKRLKRSEGVPKTKFLAEGALRSDATDLSQRAGRIVVESKTEIQLVRESAAKESEEKGDEGTEGKRKKNGYKTKVGDQYGRRTRQLIFLRQERREPIKVVRPEATDRRNRIRRC